MSDPTTKPIEEADASPTPQAPLEAPTTSDPAATAARHTVGKGKVSREFTWIVAVVVLVALGALGLKGWQRLQKAPDLNFAMDFIKTNLESPTPPHLTRLAINGQVAAFYRENGPATSVLSHDVEGRLNDPFGDPVCLTATTVQTKKGPVLIHIRVRMRKGQRSILSFVYEPQ